jgi:hypothetical protein
MCRGKNVAKELAMRSVFLAAVTLLAAGSVSSACINDRDTHRKEREFRTNYEFTSADEQSISQFQALEGPAPGERLTASKNSALTWSGGALALVGAGFMFHRAKNR